MKEADVCKDNGWPLKMCPETKQAVMEQRCDPLGRIYLLKIGLTVFCFSNYIQRCCFHSSFVTMNYKPNTGGEKYCMCKVGDCNSCLTKMDRGFNYCGNVFVPEQPQCQEDFQSPQNSSEVKIAIKRNQTFVQFLKVFLISSTTISYSDKDAEIKFPVYPFIC